MSGSEDEIPARLVRVGERLEATADTRFPGRPDDRRAAVLLALTCDAEPALVGIVRSDEGRHAGQFALPGGRIEDDDPSSWDAAVREMREEVGLREEPRRLGTLGEYNTWVSRYRVDVHVGVLAASQAWTPQDSEVAAVLELPVHRLEPLHAVLPSVESAWDLPIESGFELEAADFLVAGALPERGRGHVLPTPDGERAMPFIWGLTARVLYDFLRLAWLPSQRS